MIRSFHFIFKKDCSAIDPEKILNDFEKNFHRTNFYHKISRGDNKLILRNEFFDFNYLHTNSWILWNVCGEMTITIRPCENEKTYSIYFTVSIRRALGFFALLNIVFGIIVLKTLAVGLLYALLIYNIAAVALYFTNFFRFKHFFTKTIKFGCFYEYLVIGNNHYNWELIFKNKSNSELMQIINGRTQLPDIVIQLAKKELKNRNDNK